MIGKDNPEFEINDLYGCTRINNPSSGSFGPAERRKAQLAKAGPPFRGVSKDCFPFASQDRLIYIF